MIVKHNGRTRTVSFDERLKAAVKEARQAAQSPPHGTTREDLLKKARPTEAARRIDGWLTLRRLGPPP
jgi:hypothetical protein